MTIKIWKVQTSLSRKCVVIVQAPTEARPINRAETKAWFFTGGSFRKAMRGWGRVQVGGGGGGLTKSREKEGVGTGKGTNPRAPTLRPSVTETGKPWATLAIGRERIPFD